MIKSLTISFLIAAGILLFQCGERTVEPRIGSDLVGTWSIENVTLGGVSKKSQYSDFTLTISFSEIDSVLNYECSGQPDPSPWSAKRGTLKFGKRSDIALVRDDKIDITYTQSDNQFEMTFGYVVAEEEFPKPEEGEIVIRDPLSWYFILKK